MFDKKELNFIKTILSQLSFKVGQREQLEITESILNKMMEAETENVDQ